MAPDDSRPEATSRLNDWIDVPTLQILCRHASGVIVALAVFRIVGLFLEWTLPEGTLRLLAIAVDNFVLLGLLVWLAFQMGCHFWYRRTRQCPSTPLDGFARTIRRYLLAGLAFIPAGIGYAILNAAGYDGWFVALTFQALGFGTAFWVSGAAVVADSNRVWGLIVKRTVDVVIASVGLFIELPLFVLVALAISGTSRGPVFSRREYVGLHGRPFTLLKFRTYRMPELEETMGPVWASQADPLITPVGRFLRRTRLDELPLLINVLFGDMSLVGPRALSGDSLSLLREDVRVKREEVRPGITGLAQVECLDKDAFVERVKYDLIYIEKWSLRLDLVVLRRTVRIVLFSKGPEDSEVLQISRGRLGFGILLSGPFLATASVVVVLLRHLLR